MRSRAALALALFALTGAASGCGGDEGAAGSSVQLVWKGEPQVYVPPTLPGDRILRAEVKNEGLDKLTVDSADVALLDGEGKPVEGVATFAPAYVHPLYPYGRGPGSGRDRLPEEERRRIGLVAEVQPGKSVPLTVSWHEPPGRRTAVEIDYGPGSLEIPASAERAKPSKAQR